MRTTVTLSDDVSAAVDRLRKERSIGVSEAVNELVRSGLAVKPERKEFKQRTHKLEARIDITDIANALETLEGPAYR